MMKLEVRRWQEEAAVSRGQRNTPGNLDLGGVWHDNGTLLERYRHAMRGALAADRVYDESGSVWTVGYIETKPGHFDDYIANLHSIWKRYLDEQKKDGSVLSYKMIAVGFPRDGEPDLMLMVEYKNYAAFDRGNAYFDELAKKLQGGTEQATQSNIDREALRELRGGWVGRELTFKD